MKRPSGKWLSIFIAVLVAGGLALYAASAGNQKISTTSLPTAAPTVAAPGATPAPDLAAAPAASGSAVPGMSVGSLISLVLKVGIVAALLALSLWALRKYAGSGPRSGGRTGAIQIVDTISVAQNRAFYVLDVGDRAVVVGATPQQLAVVAEVTDEDVLARLRQRPQAAAPPLAGLWRQFGNMRERQNELRSVAQAHRPEPEEAPVTDPPARRSKPAARPAARAAAEPARLQPTNGESFARTLAAASIAQQAEPAPAPRPRPAALPAIDDTERLRALSERLGAAQEGAR